MRCHLSHLRILIICRSAVVAAADKLDREHYLVNAGTAVLLAGPVSKSTVKLSWVISASPKECHCGSSSVHVSAVVLCVLRGR